MTDIQSPAPTVLACVPSSKALKFYPAFACVMAYDLSESDMFPSTFGLVIHSAPDILLLTVWKAVKQCASAFFLLYL